MSFSELRGMYWVLVYVSYRLLPFSYYVVIGMGTTAI